MAFVMAAIYDNLRSALTGSGWLRGFKYGLVIALLYTTFGAGYSGVFNLPNAIWFWWALDGFIIFPMSKANPVPPPAF